MLHFGTFKPFIWLLSQLSGKTYNIISMNKGSNKTQHCSESCFDSETYVKVLLGWELNGENGGLTFGLAENASFSNLAFFSQKSFIDQ